MFNALKYIKSLENVGFRREQAEAQVQLVLDSFEDNMATKSDIAEVRSDIAGVKSEVADVRSEIAEVKAEVADVRSEIAEVKAQVADVRSEITVLRAETKAQISDLKTDIVIKLGGLMVIWTTVTTSVLGFLIKS